MDKVEAKHDITYVFGKESKVSIKIKKGQRWYVICKGGCHVYLERDNVRMQMYKDEFDSLFAPSKRTSKYG